MFDHRKPPPMPKVTRNIGQRRKDAKAFERLIADVRKLPPMTEAEHREQRADWTFGQMACMSRYKNASKEELDALKAYCRKLAGCKD